MCDSGSWTSCTLSTITPLASLWVGSMSNSLIVFLCLTYITLVLFLHFYQKNVSTDCCPTKMLSDQNDVSFDNAEQDLLKAFGGAYVMHLLPSSPNWAAQVLVVKYFISPHFAEFTKDVVWHQEQ